MPWNCLRHNTDSIVLVRAVTNCTNLICMGLHGIQKGQASCQCRVVQHINRLPMPATHTTMLLSKRQKYDLGSGMASSTAWPRLGT